MILKVESYFNKNYDTSFMAKVPDRKLIISCFDGKEILVDKDKFINLTKKSKKNTFFESVKNIVLELIPSLDSNYRKMMKLGKKV